VILCEKQRNSILYATTDLAMNVVKAERLPVEETDDSCIFKYFEIVFHLPQILMFPLQRNVSVEMVLLNSNKKT